MDFFIIFIQLLTIINIYYMKFKEASNNLKNNHKIKIISTPIFANSYKKDDILEIDYIMHTGNRVRVYPKYSKNKYEYLYNDEYEIYI